MTDLKTLGPPFYKRSKHVQNAKKTVKNQRPSMSRGPTIYYYYHRFIAIIHIYTLKLY